VRVLLDVSAVPARPVGAGVYTVALASGLAAHSAVELHLLTRKDDDARWRTLAPGADVHAAVGKAKTVRFENGFEVWAYRIIDQAKAKAAAAKARSGAEEEGPAPETELVVLFDPSGTATKVRLGPDVVFTD